MSIERLVSPKHPCSHPGCRAPAQKSTYDSPAPLCYYHDKSRDEDRLRAAAAGRAKQAEQRHAPTDFETHLAACERQDHLDALRNDRMLLFWVLWVRAGQPPSALNCTAMTLFHFWVRKAFPEREKLYYPEWLRERALVHDLTQLIEDRVREVLAPQGVSDEKVWKEFTKVPMPELAALPAEPQMIPRPPSPLTGPVVQLEMRG